MHKRAKFCQNQSNSSQDWRFFIFFFKMAAVAAILGFVGHILGGLYYRPRSRGDNTFGSIRMCVRPFVCGHCPV